MTKQQAQAAYRTRKQVERERKREAGLKPLEVWVHVDDAQSVRRYVERMNRKRWPQGVEQ